jgi:hypothetical protein
MGITSGVHRKLPKRLFSCVARNTGLLMRIQLLYFTYNELVDRASCIFFVLVNTCILTASSCALWRSIFKYFIDDLLS